MTTLCVKNATVIATMDGQTNDIPDGAILVEDNRIRWLGPTAALDRWLAENRPAWTREGFDRVIDAAGCVLLPGLVNCHHHLYQTLTRTVATGAGKSCSIG